jgi:hypothetical protein
MWNFISLNSYIPRATPVSHRHVVGEYLFDETTVNVNDYIPVVISV